MSGLISFLGGTAFRWLFGELIGFFRAKQEHEQEMQRMRLSFEQDAQRHQWQQEAIAAQAAAGVRVIEAQAQAASGAAADAAFLAAVQGIDTASKRADWIGAFNALIRPELAQVSILLLAGHAIWPDVVVLQGIVAEVVCGALGLFIGERIKHRGA